ncbi:hypothetical protein CR513_37362, partial [Mucuna pruriens]
MLPNKVAYKANPKESKEIQQVAKLVEKCRVCENDLLNELHGSSVFSKIYLRSEYHQICVREGDEWKTTLKTKFGHMNS